MHRPQLAIDIQTYLTKSLPRPAKSIPTQHRPTKHPLNESMNPEAMFPSPSHTEIDGVDLNTLLAYSPSMQPLGVLTPTSSQRSHSASLASDSAYHAHLDDMALPDEAAAMQQFFMPSISNASYYPASTATSTQQMYQYSNADAYSDFGQQQWMSLPLYAQQAVSPPMDDGPPSCIYPTFETPAISSGGLFVPPAPQSPFSFSTNISPQRESYLRVSRKASDTNETMHSISGSVSSLSRSCSPSETLIKESFASSVFPIHSTPGSSASSSSTSLLAYGIPVPQAGTQSPQTWRCAYPGCTSRALFTRGCDLRKHFNRHSKHLFCRVEGCPQSAASSAKDLDGRRGSNFGGGFSSKKDRARHEAKHNPGIRCEWRGPEGEDCGRVFSRMDNMKDHVRRIHRKGSR